MGVPANGVVDASSGGRSRSSSLFSLCQFMVGKNTMAIHGGIVGEL